MRNAGRSANTIIKDPNFSKTILYYIGRRNNCDVATITATSIVGQNSFEVHGRILLSKPPGAVNFEQGEQACCADENKTQSPGRKNM